LGLSPVQVSTAEPNHAKGAEVDLISELDVTSLSCPVPLIRLAKAAAEVPAGGRLRVTGDDPVFEEEVRDYCQEHGLGVLEVTRAGRRVSILLQL
jgi:TusA-related sulfurtransferase